MSVLLLFLLFLSQIRGEIPNREKYVKEKSARGVYIYVSVNAYFFLHHIVALLK